MTFVLDALRDNPVALFAMDDTTPLQDYSPFNTTATTSGGTPAQVAALVKGTAWAPVFNNTINTSFNCPVFNKGFENRPFSLESWLCPLPLTTGFTAPSTKTNLEINPITTAGNYAYSTSAWGTAPTSSFPASGGPDNGTYKRGIATVAFTPAAQSVIMLQQIALTGITATASILAKVGETYTVSIYVRSSIAQSVALLAQPLTAAGAGATGAGNGGDVTLVANTWTRLSVTWTATDVNTAALRLDVRASFGGSRLAWAIGDTFDVASVLITSGSTLYPYFDGNYVGYKWNGTTNASTATTNPAVSLINYALNPTGGGGTTTFAWGAIGAGAGTTSAVVDATAPVGGGFVRRTTTDANAGGIGVNTFNVPEGTINSSVWVRSSVATTFNLFVQGTAGKVANSPTFALAANTWQRISVTHTITRAGTLQVGGFYTTNLAIGVTLDFTGAMSVQGSTVLPYFDGTYVGAAFNGTNPTAPSYMLVSNSDQQVLSHSGTYDGLTVNGTVVSFKTKYVASPDSVCSYDLQQIRACHAVGVHSASKDSLYIDGALVAENNLTAQQVADQFVSAGTTLVTGTTISSQQVAVNGVGFYAVALTADVIGRHFSMGRRLPAPKDVVPALGGDYVPVSLSNSVLFLDQWIQTAEDWNQGMFDNTAVYKDQLVPTADSTGVSVAGVWNKSISLDSANSSTIYGVQLNWSGVGATVQVSLDGTTWETVTKGVNCTTVPAGTSTANQVLQIRITFAGGTINDLSYVDNLNIVGITSATSLVIGGRTTTPTLAYPERDYPFTEYHDNYGTQIDSGGTLVISADTLGSTVARTLEVLIKSRGGTPTISMTGTNYVNGAAATPTFPSGQWVLWHIVAAADVAGSITINGPCQIGYVGIYGTALSAGTIAGIYSEYVGTDAPRFADASVIGVSESPTAANIYQHDWAISASG